MRFHKYFALTLMIFSSIMSSCASHTAVYPDPVNIQSVIKPGNTVKVVTKDNQETKFIVTEVTDEAIIGENQKVLFTDIAKLQEQTVSAGENFGIISLFIIGGAAGAAADCASSSCLEYDLRDADWYGK